MLSIESRFGDPIAASEMRLVPVARSVRLELGRGALVWTRAVGLRVEAGGRETVVPIRDRTRQLQVALLALGLAGSLILRFVRGRRRRR